MQKLNAASACCITKVAVNRRISPNSWNGISKPPFKIMQLRKATSAHYMAKATVCSKISPERWNVISKPASQNPADARSKIRMMYLCG